MVRKSVSRKSLKRPKKTEKKKSVRKTKTSDLLIVFDLDETIMQFLHAKNAPDAIRLWEKASDEEKQRLHYVIDSKGHVVVLRPHLLELFDFCKKNKHVRIGLWTLSERDYGKTIAKILTKEFDLPPNFFLFVYGDEDVENYETRKDLSMIWKQFPTYHQHNTFLVDDLKTNIMHSINRKNGFLTPEFAPFGTKKDREEMDNASSTIASSLKDKVMKEVIKLAKKVITYNHDHPDDRRPLFDKKRMAEMKMSSYLKEVVKNKEIELVRVATIGRPRKTIVM